MGPLVLSALYFLSLKEEGEKTAAIKEVEKKRAECKVPLHSMCSLHFVSSDNFFEEFDSSLVCLVNTFLKTYFFIFCCSNVHSSRVWKKKNPKLACKNGAVG